MINLWAIHGNLRDLSLSMNYRKLSTKITLPSKINCKNKPA